jgi:hypothetical protein
MDLEEWGCSENEGPGQGRGVESDPALDPSSHDTPVRGPYPTLKDW